MSRTETLDNTKMTNGPITRILLSFAGPVLLGQLLQRFIILLMQLLLDSS